MTREEGDRTRHLIALETVVMVLLAFTALRVTTPLMALAAGTTRLPQWDAAKYGVSGLRLARALQDHDALAFLHHLNGLDVWPPVFPLLEVPAFVLAGPGYASARGFVALLIAAAIASAFWCGWQSTRQWGYVVGALTAALVATSPMAQVFATLVMLEIPGTLLLLLAVGSYLRSLKTDKVEDFTIACIAATALFFCKYNYGLIWIVPMAANEVLRLYGRAGLRPSTVWRRLIPSLTRPWSVCASICLLTAVIIEVAGPWRFTVAGEVVSVGSAGPPLYAFYALTLLSLLLRPRRSLDRGRRWIARLEPRSRSMVCTIALPIALWMVVPSHAINFVRFLVNRSAGPPVLSLESLLAYPGAFVNEFSPSRAVGVVVLLVGAASLHRLRGADEAGRVLALALLFSSVALIAHPYKLPRFLFITSALLWLAGSREATLLLVRVSSRVGGTAQRSFAAAVAVTGLAAAAFVAVDMDRVERGHRRHTVDPSTAEVVDAITDGAAEVRASVLLGTWNHLSPWLVEWSCLQRGQSMAPTKVPREPTGRARRGDVVGWLVSDPPELVMVLSAAPGSVPRAGFAAETRWLDPVRRELASDPDFTRLETRDFPVAGYRLEYYRPTRTGAQPVPR